MRTSSPKLQLGWLALLALILLLQVSPLAAQEMRELQVQARQTKETLMQQAANEKTEAQQAAAASRAAIIKDQEALQKQISLLEAGNRKLSVELQQLTDQAKSLDVTESQLTQKLTQTDGMIKELIGVIRINAKDIDNLINRNLQTALSGQTSTFLAAVAEESQFPGMGDIRNMASSLQNQIKISGEVGRKQGHIIDQSGQEVESEVLLLGPFTAAYRINSEVGFLNYSSSGGKLYALSRQPAKRMRKQITQYMDGQSPTVPVDISRGGALRQLTHKLSLGEQIPKGGPIVWPILAIFLIGVLIIIERVLFLFRKHLKVDTLFHKIETAAAANDWPTGLQACDKHRKKPVAQILRAGLSCHYMPREEIENALQEAILKEIPPMERFLSTLGMLAAIAPLLGLLGTVTGMIDTFHVITLYGTGDPRLMSGGISEALVTTMLGLSVAIPLMMGQTLLNRTVEKRISQMEEKAVALVNIIDKNRKTS
ncbi:MAG: MotA/TolQ/ExbB proton channel family protein [Deltaproteobacteria bacterium]|nr:MotA/TolQ/ExbB proton channel family protein [Candidatus Tharpella sp.]